MSIFEHSRFSIFNPAQHPLKHDISAFGYMNNSLPGVSTLEEALDYIIAVLYPHAKAAVANVAALPAVGNTDNDYRIVLDDGDGKAAGYRWNKWEGELVYSWHKIYDFDWTTDSIVAQFLLKTQDQYAYKYGYDDLDKDGVVISGVFAGQTIYGGASANTNLTLRANSGDGAGASTGYVQVDDNFRPAVTEEYDLGKTDFRFKNGWFSDSIVSDTMTISSGSITDTTGEIDFDDEDLVTTGTLSCSTITGLTSLGVDTLSFATGSITDSTGAISFGNENLSTTGTFASGTITVSTTLVLASGSITDTTGEIDFGNEDLVTTGALGAGVITGTQLNVDFVRIDGDTISITDEDESLNISSGLNGTINTLNLLNTVGVYVTGILNVVGSCTIDNFEFDGNKIVSTNLNGNIILDPNGTGLVELSSGFFPTTNSAHDIGKTGSVWNDLWIDGNIKNDTTIFAISELMTLRNIAFRDAARTQAVQAGDTLFYDAVSGTWLANHPDTEVTHSELTGLTTTDAGHTQFVMLAGRAGGQTIQGGTAASNSLILESTAHATKGDILVKDDLCPFTNASYSGGWAGADLGDATHNYRDIYMKGEARGLRFENFTSLTLPASSATSVGRVVYSTDDGRVYIDDGSAFNAIGGSAKFVEDLVFNGSDTTKNVDVSSVIGDARNCLVQLLDNSNDFEQINCKILRTSASNVRIITNVALPAGSYRLIVIE
jgi:hypothetical protein